MRHGHNKNVGLETRLVEFLQQLVVVGVRAVGVVRSSGVGGLALGEGVLDQNGSEKSKKIVNFRKSPKNLTQWNSYHQVGCCTFSAQILDFSSEIEISSPKYKGNLFFNL